MFQKFEYEKVLVGVMADYGLDGRINPQEFTKRYFNDWQNAIAILPDGFNFEKEMYPVIQLPGRI